MNALTTTRAPSSYQFRLAASSARKSPSVFLHIRVHKLHRQFQCFSASIDNGNGNVTELPTNSNSNSSVDPFSGWLVKNNASQESNDPKPKISLSGGIVVAGVILVAGLSFAVFSISKNASVSKQKMESFTTHQEEKLFSVEQNDTVEDDESMVDDVHLESKTALREISMNVLVPAVVDQVQANALAALQVLKVIEGDVQPGDICSRREYARWLVSASSALSRNTISKVYPAMYIENFTELAFDDITPNDPDFSSIQGLAEAGIIASKLSRNDMNPSDQNESTLNFSPESPLSRQDLVSWKMSLEKRLLPVADKMILEECSSFIDIDKINPDAWPALIADLSAGEQGIISLAFGYTKLFQPNKPVTKAQAAIALTTGEASYVVSEELARIEAESIAEKAVSAHTALVDQVEKDLNANYEKQLLLEMEKISIVEKMAEDLKQEMEKLKDEREKENIELKEERAAVDAEMEVFLKLRHEVEEELQSIMSNKVEIADEKKKLNKIMGDVDFENQEIVRLRNELEVERKALSMARSWAEDEAKRAREQAKVVEESRNHWKNQGLKVVVDNDLREETDAGVTWLTAGNPFSIEGTKDRAQNLVEKLKPMITDVTGKPREIIEMIIQKVLVFISKVKDWTSKTMTKVDSSTQDLQQSFVGLRSTITEGVEKVAHKFRM